MKIDSLILGMVSTNCYIVSDEITKEAIVIDPADQADKIIEFLEHEQLSLQAILLTHGHFDHIMGVEELKKHFGVKVYASMAEEKLLLNPGWNCSIQIAKNVSIIADEWVEEGNQLVFGPLHLKVIETPGHTRGSICYYFESEHVLFSGDTLFLESVGRCDLPTGNAQRLVESVVNKLMILPDETIVYPGHGKETSIGYEKRNNAYINGNGWD